jgi:hypothetical protein
MPEIDLGHSPAPQHLAQLVAAREPTRRIHMLCSP